MERVPRVVRVRSDPADRKIGAELACERRICPKQGLGRPRTWLRASSTAIQGGCRPGVCALYWVHAPPREAMSEH